MNKEHIRVWWQNASTWHNRIMANYLRKRGWVVFYLDPRSRECNATCWLKLYQQSEDNDH